MTILRLIFMRKIIYRKGYLFIVDTKITIFPREVRQVSPSPDVWICLATKNRHIDIFDQNLKKI